MDGTMASPMLSRLPRGYRNDRQFGLVYDHLPARPDDLTLIAGIATREAVILNRLGVYFVAQIGLWRAQEISSVAHELQISPIRITDERWVEQAQSLCPSVSDVRASHGELPASFLRTISLLTCALMLGFFCVYLLGNRNRAGLQGVLSADITAVKVPAESRLIASHVKPGDEVFSGAALLTLEKASHITMIEEQERRVQHLQQELEKAQAQADLETVWRVREVERELFDARSQIAAIRAAPEESAESVRTAGIQNSGKQNAGIPKTAGRVQASPVSSSSRQPKVHVARRAGGLIFFSGASGQSTKISDEPGLPPAPVPVPVPTRIAQAKPAFISEPVAAVAAASATSAHVLSLEARLERLESLRAALPDQVRQAAGLEHIRVRFDDAVNRLEEMKSVSRELAVTSPSYGVVGQVRFREGDLMQEGEIMLKILHTDRRYVIVYVPTRRVNELQPGNEVELIFPGKERYRGQVTDLPMLADTLVPGTESMAAVRVEQAGRLWPQVPIGSQIDVAIIQ